MAMVMMMTIDKLVTRLSTCLKVEKSACTHTAPGGAERGGEKKQRDLSVQEKRKGKKQKHKLLHKLL